MLKGQAKAGRPAFFIQNLVSTVVPVWGVGDIHDTKDTAMTAMNVEKPNKARTRKDTMTATMHKHVEKPKTRTRKPDDNLGRWCMAYVVLAAVMSMGLNAWANGQHAPAGTQWAAWGMGASIPVLVLLLGKVAGLCYKRGNRPLAYAAGGVGVAVLALSVFHCYQSISLLTGSGWLVACLLAIGVDAGMVVAEVVSVVEND